MNETKTEVEAEDFSIRMDVEVGPDHPPGRFNATVSGPAIGYWDSGMQLTKRLAWERLVTVLLRAIVALRRQRSDQKAYIDQLRALLNDANAKLREKAASQPESMPLTDKVLADEVRAHHDAVEEITKMQGWLDEEKAKVRALRAHIAAAQSALDQGHRIGTKT